MNDKEKLKNDEIVESSNKSDEKLVSRAGYHKLKVTNNTSEIICINLDGYVVEYAAGCSNVDSDWLDPYNTVEVYAKTSGLSISAQLYTTSSPSTLINEWTNQKIITINIDDVGMSSPFIITSAEVVIPPTLYLNESYSVPNMLDPVITANYFNSTGTMILNIYDSNDSIMSSETLTSNTNGTIYIPYSAAKIGIAYPSGQWYNSYIYIRGQTENQTNRYSGTYIVYYGGDIGGFIHSTQTFKQYHHIALDLGVSDEPV